MAACEKCWGIYQGRCHAGLSDTYADVLREFEGRHTLAEQCGDLHLMLVVDKYTKRCRCGQREYKDVRRMVEDIASKREATRGSERR